MRCPVSLKLNNLAEVVRINENEPGGKSAKYYQRTRDGKQLLRDAMANYIPAAVAQREKQGFSAPDASWFKGESIDFVRRRLMGGESRIAHWLDFSPLQDLIESHLSGAENHRLLIWSLLSVEQWLETYNIEG
jgi:asparagine synthase (glutamine-hydrolysing)